MTKKQAREEGLCNRKVLLNKHSKVPQTKGVVVKGEVFYSPDSEEKVRSRNAWKEQGRTVKKGSRTVGTRTTFVGIPIKYKLYRKKDTESS